MNKIILSGWLGQLVGKMYHIEIYDKFGPQGSGHPAGAGSRRA
jgi:hypothetical protein